MMPVSGRVKVPNAVSARLKSNSTCSIFCVLSWAPDMVTSLQFSRLKIIGAQTDFGKSSIKLATGVFAEILE